MSQMPLIFLPFLAKKCSLKQGPELERKAINIKA